MTATYPNPEILAAELHELARVDRPFDHPLKIRARCPTALALSGQARANTKNPGPYDDILAFQTELCCAVEAISDEATRVFAHILLGTMSEEQAEQHGLALEDVFPKHLYQRQDLGPELGYMTSPSAVRRDEPRLLAIVAGHLVARLAKLGVPESGSVLSTGPRAIRGALLDHFPGRSPVGKLAEALIPDRPPYVDARVELSLSDLDDNDSDEYLYTATVTATAAIEEYVLALVRRTADVDSTLVTSPRVCDLYLTRGNLETWQQTVEETLSSPSALAAKDPTPRRGTQFTSVPLERIPETEWSEYVGDRTDLTEETVALLRADLRSFQDMDGLVRFQLAQQLRLATKDHIAFWLADRPYYLQGLSIDTSDLTLPAGSEPRVQAFLLATPDSLWVPASGRRDIQLEEWVLPGHGLAIVW